MKKMKKFFTLIVFMFAGTAFADTYCAYPPNTDRPDSGGSVYHIEMRDSAEEHLLVNTTRSTRVDVQTVFSSNVYYFYNKNPAQIAASGGGWSYFGKDSSNIFTGHSSEAYKFDELGRQSVYAAIFASGGVNGQVWTCDDWDQAYCQASCPIWDPATQAANGCANEVTTSGTEVICAVRDYIVQTKPTISIVGKSFNNGGIKINTNINISPDSKVYSEGNLPTISYTYSHEDFPQITGTKVSNNTSETIFPPYSGPYRISVRVFDGTFSSSAVNTTSFNPYGSPCNTCGMIP